jgi:hypothetical protein
VPRSDAPCHLEDVTVTRDLIVIPRCAGSDRWRTYSATRVRFLLLRGGAIEGVDRTVSEALKSLRLPSGRANRRSIKSLRSFLMGRSRNEFAFQSSYQYARVKDDPLYCQFVAEVDGARRTD